MNDNQKNHIHHFHLPVTTHRYQGYGILDVGLSLGITEQLNSIVLSVKAGGQVIAIPHPFGIVQNYDGGFQNHPQIIIIMCMCLLGLPTKGNIIVFNFILLFNQIRQSSHLIGIAKGHG